MATQNMRRAYDEYINSERWRLKRKEYLDSASTQSDCAGCGYSGPGIEIHHKTYLHLGNEPLDDLVAVCFRCHKLIHQDINSWDERLAQHTENVLAEIRRKVSSGEMTPTTVTDRRVPLPAEKQRTDTPLGKKKPGRSRKKTKAQRRAEDRFENDVRALRMKMSGMSREEIKQELLRQRDERDQRMLDRSRARQSRPQPKVTPEPVSRPGTRDPNAAVFDRIRAAQRGEGGRSSRKARQRRLNGL